MWSSVTCFFVSHYVFKTHLCCSMSAPHSFLLSNNSPLYGSTIFYISLSSLVDIWVLSTLWPLRIVFLWTFWPIFLCGRVFSFLLARYFRVEWLGHVVTPCLTFWGPARLFSRATASSYIPTSRVGGGFQCFHILANTCSRLSFSWQPSCEVWSGIPWVLSL